MHYLQARKHLEKSVCGLKKEKKEKKNQQIE